MLAEIHPKLNEKYKSKQYSLAQKIISKKLSLKVSQRALSSLMGLPYSKYLQMESGSIEIPIEDYEMALKKVEKLDRNTLKPTYLIPAYTDKISEYPTYKINIDNEETIDKGIVFNNQQDIAHSSMDIKTCIQEVGDSNFIGKRLLRELNVENVIEQVERNYQAIKITNEYREYDAYFTYKTYEYSEEIFDNVSRSA